MKIVDRLVCWLEGTWHTFTSFLKTGDGTRIEGHLFVEEERHKNVWVYIERCRDCGKQEISWSTEELPE